MEEDAREETPSLPCLNKIEEDLREEDLDL